MINLNICRIHSSITTKLQSIDDDKIHKFKNYVQTTATADNKSGVKMFYIKQIQLSPF